MAFVEKTLRQRALEVAQGATDMRDRERADNTLDKRDQESGGGQGDDLTELVEFINRELIPVVLELRREVNRLGGTVRSITDDSVDGDLDVKRTDSILNCGNATLAKNLTLAPAEDVEGKVVTIKSTGAAAVEVFAQAGELIDSASSVVIATDKALTLYSDGTQFWIIGEVD